MDDYNAGDFQLDDLIREASEITLAQGFHLPTIFAVGTRGMGMMVIPEMPPTHEMRLGAMYVLGWEVSRQAIGQLRNVVFILESWMSRNFGMMPSEDPNRMEVLMINHYIVRERRNELVGLLMIRDREGKLADMVIHTDTRNEEGNMPESPLMDEFMRGYHAGRKGRMPPTTGRRG